jgi:ubiquinone/menaquinone biosynthesis C-methylase UbiE
VTFTDVPIDDVRDWWDSRPCNLHHSDAPVGSRRYFAEVEARKYRVEPHIPGFAEFDRWAGRRVLEIGCGIGTDTINFARAGATVVATDLSAESVRIASDRAVLFEVDDQVRFVNGDAERLDDLLDSEPFDLIYSFGVIHHSPHPDRILQQAYRFAGPSSELRIMLYHRRSTKVLALIARHPLRALRGVDRAVAVQSEAQRGSPVTYSYTRRQARRLVERAGFNVETVTVDHIFPYAIGPYRQHVLRRRWYWRPIPPRMFRWLERRFGWHLLIVGRPS